MTATPVDSAAARQALQARTRQTVALLDAIADPAADTAGLEWTLGETAAHMVIAARAYAGSAAGQIGVITEAIPDLPIYEHRMKAVTSGTLATIPERDPAVLGTLLTEAVESFLEASADRPGSERIPTPWYGENAGLSLDASTCLLLGEQVIHGRDIATSIRTPWHLDKPEALLMIHSLVEMMPIAVRADATRNRDISCAMHIRGGPQFLVRVDHGKASVEPLTDQRVDCHLSADPVAFLLVGYGRLNQWKGIALGKLFSWGRKPWLAVQFKGLFFNP